MIKFVIFGLGIDIGGKSIKSIGGKESFLVLFLPIKVLNTSEKYRQRHNRNKANIHECFPEILDRR